MMRSTVLIDTKSSSTVTTTTTTRSHSLRASSSSSSSSSRSKVHSTDHKHIRTTLRTTNNVDEDKDERAKAKTTRRSAFLIAIASVASNTYYCYHVRDPTRDAVASTSEWDSLNDGSSPGLASREKPGGVIKKTEVLGLKYELLATGEGDDVVNIDDVVDVDYVMRRANGYFIYSNADCGIGCGTGEPERWKIGDGSFVETIPEILVGMRKGEVRKFLVKPEFGYLRNPKTLKPQPPEYGQRRQIESHASEPILFEVRVVKIRKQQQQQRR